MKRPSSLLLAVFSILVFGNADAAPDDSGASDPHAVPIVPLSISGKEFAVAATVTGDARLAGVQLVFSLSDITLRAKDDIEICAIGFAISKKKPDGQYFEPVATAAAEPIYLRLEKDVDRKVGPFTFQIPLAAVFHAFSEEWPTFVMISVLNGQCGGAFNYVHGKPGDLIPILGPR